MNKKDRIAKIAREVIQREQGPASTSMIWEAVNQKIREGAYHASVHSILKARKDLKMVAPAMWDLNESIDADESLGVN
tara:strand:+ start:2541 stop:2774 length:234 start_codon:yes stop_codon:yes gene_type:complete